MAKKYRLYSQKFDISNSVWVSKLKSKGNVEEDYDLDSIKGKRTKKKKKDKKKCRIWEVDDITGRLLDEIETEDTPKKKPKKTKTPKAPKPKGNKKKNK